jgi:hypothetical protein
MGIKSFIKQKFFATIGSRASTPTDKVTASKTITNDLLGYLLGLSDFSNLDEDEIYEQLYIWEPEIGGAIDRMSTMVGESYKYPYVKDVGETMDDIEEKMIKDAIKISDEVDIRHYFEIFAEILEMHGNLYLEIKDDMSFEILPNKYVTLVDSRDRLINSAGTTFADNIITKCNFLVLYEGMTGQKILPKDKFIHIKYKDTPIFVTDTRGRSTYGVYSSSPLHRTILPVWWKRQTMIIDIMWRYRNVPREHHKISAEMFSLDKYLGDISTRRASAMADAKTFLDTYVETIQNQMPDQGYATLDTVDISVIDNGSAKYMQPNDLIDQTNNQIWAALNMPKSMISGESTSSYASELVIANYVTQKVNQLTNKIKPVILKVLRARLKKLNSTYPVDTLDLKMELSIASTELEVFREMAIMADVGVFTESEIREKGKYRPLRDDQRDSIVSKGVNPGSTEVPKVGVPPETPESQSQHATDSGENDYRKIER